MGNFFDKHLSALCVLFIFILFFSISYYIYSRADAEEQNLRSGLARLSEARTRFESRYQECLDILLDRNIALLNLRLEFDRKAAAAFENCHSNSFSVEHSPLSDFPKHFYERGFALSLRRDIKLIKARIKYESEHSLNLSSLISGGCISSSDDD